MSKRTVPTVISLGLILFVSYSLSRDVPAAPPEKQEPALKKFMRAKLGASNQILERLVTEDFALIAKGSEKLQEMSAMEQWRVSNDAMYRQHSGEFRRIVVQLEKKAKDKKLEGAALTWIEATMSCIECHKHARAMLIADRKRE